MDNLCNNRNESNYIVNEKAEKKKFELPEPRKAFGNKDAKVLETHYAELPPTNGQPLYFDLDEVIEK